MNGPQPEPTPLEKLAQYSHLKVSTFLSFSYQRDCPLDQVDAFWCHVFRDHMEVDRSVAEAAARELEVADKTVGDVLDGWTPPALRPKCRRCGEPLGLCSKLCDLI